jgi:hypothetical protein
MTAPVGEPTCLNDGTRRRIGGAQASEGRKATMKNLRTMARPSIACVTLRAGPDRTAPARQETRAVQPGPRQRRSGPLAVSRAAGAYVEAGGPGSYSVGALLRLGRRGGRQ